VGGGAWFPSAQAALSDRANTRRSYLVPVAGYLTMTMYAVGLVISQALKSGFHVRNIDQSKEHDRKAGGMESRNSNKEGNASVETVAKA